MNSMNSANPSTDEKMWVICPVCHKANPVGARFCQHCWGAAIYPDEPLTTAQLEERLRVKNKSQKRRKLTRMGIFAAIGAAALLVVFFGLSRLTDVVSQPNATLNSSSRAGEWSMFHRDLGRTGSDGSISKAPEGTLLWKFEAGAPVNSSPAVANGTVYFGSQDYNFYAVDAKTGTINWHYTTGSWVDSSPTVAAGKVFFGSNDGKLYALNAQTGQTVWDFSTTYPIRSAAAIAGDYLIFGSEDYFLYGLNTATGEKIWQYDTKSPAVSQPVVSSGVAIIGAADGYAYSFNAENGQRRLRFRTHYAIYGGPISTADGTTYVITTNGRLYAYNGLLRTSLQEHEIKPFWTQLYMMGVPGIPAPTQQTGYLWMVNLRGTVNNSPILANDVIYFGLGSQLVAVDTKTQERLWAFPTKGPVRSTPAISGETIVFGSDDGKLYALDASTGKKLWDFQTGSKITSSPAFVDGVIYFGSDDGNFYAIK